MSTLPSCPAPGEVRAWHGHIDVFAREPARVDRALGWLSESERARFARYRRQEDREMFLLGRVMARASVGRAAGRPPAAWPWRDGPRGRPEIADPDVPLRFSLAHSAGLVACALAGDRDVGVDVEDRRRRPLDRRIVRRYCSPAETEDIDAQGDAGWHDRFLSYWTIKEAYLKARGLGISVPLAEIDVRLDDGGARVRFLASLEGADTRWAFQVQAPTPRHVLALAAPIAAGPVSFVVEPFPDAWLP
jgi:4'-phosphopantetheinyl transferase